MHAEPYLDHLDFCLDARGSITSKNIRLIYTKLMVTFKKLYPFVFFLSFINCIFWINL